MSFLAKRRKRINESILVPFFVSYLSDFNSSLNHLLVLI
jgi:hypothetical protein